MAYLFLQFRLVVIVRYQTDFHHLRPKHFHVLLFFYRNQYGLPLCSYYPVSYTHLDVYKRQVVD